ncbi:MAG TPA: ion channel, partial [Micropepsaceae bacterium]|nr:ion channel [Micropepsaceae bacterium]
MTEPTQWKNNERTMTVRLGAFELRKRGVSRFDFRDTYHHAIETSWPRFFLALFAFDLLINLIFAALYLARPDSIQNAHPGSFSDAFFFSLETLATVGYGEMAPNSLYGHVVSATEIIFGLTFTAIMTGLIFVRFSKPKAKIIYAQKVVVAVHNGKPHLMVRIGNGRMGLLTNATAQLGALLIEYTSEGEIFRRVHDLKLLRSRLPIFALTWTIMHPLDEESPLFDYGPEKLEKDDVRLFLTIEARDQALAAEVYDMKDYSAADVAFE